MRTFRTLSTRRAHTLRSVIRNGTSESGIDRRRFLGIVGSLAAATAASACHSEPTTTTADLDRPELLDALGADRVSALGRRYREMVPAERAVEPLRDAITRSQPWTARLPWSAPPPVRELVQRDFEAGRIVTVDGWILSATEARQCALFSLLPG
jgi:hypothetical protein